MTQRFAFARAHIASQAQTASSWPSALPLTHQHMHDTAGWPHHQAATMSAHDTAQFFTHKDIHTQKYTNTHTPAYTSHSLQYSQGGVCLIRASHC